MTKQILIFSLLLALGLTANSHEGHDTPGALPPAPHGGKLAEAAHSTTHNSNEKEEAELFIEAKLEGAKLKLYPHTLEANNNKVFKSIKPNPNLLLSEVKIELPRSKKMNILKAAVADDSWESDIGAVREKRILVHAVFMDGKEKKTVKIQIER